VYRLPCLLEVSCPCNLALQKAGGDKFLLLLSTAILIRILETRYTAAKDIGLAFGTFHAVPPLGFIGTNLAIHEKNNLILRTKKFIHVYYRG